jgi:SAM-dependent methyltransferase
VVYLSRFGVMVPTLLEPCQRVHSWLRPTARRVQRLLSFLGFDARRLISNIRGLPGFIRGIIIYGRGAPRASFRVTAKDLWPILYERRQAAGAAGGAYFHQDLWAARKIFQRHPAQHLDIGSRIDGFVAHLLVFMPVTVVDIRTIENGIEGLTFVCDDATDLETLEDDSIDSLSSLHAAEHFGLGRYSDPIDPHACFRFMSALQRVLAPGGRLYFSVPIGRERCEFNAHRVFSVSTVLETFTSLRLLSFSLAGDDGSFQENAQPGNLGAPEHSCGLFEFTKTIADA